MDFKVGDKVRVLDGSGCNDYNCGWVDEMDETVGAVGKITWILHGRCEIEGLFWTYDTRYIELVGE